MKKFLNYFLALAMIIIASVSVASCSKDDDEPKSSGKSELVGTWISSSDGISYTLTLSSNHTGSVKAVINSTVRATISATMSEDFNWTVSESSSGSKYIDLIHTGGDYVLVDEGDSSSSWIYIVAGNRLSLGNLTFTRSK